MTVGKILKEARLKKELSVKQVAETMGFSDSAWFKIESGDRSLGVDFVKPVCDFLDIPYSCILEVMGIPSLRQYDEEINDVSGDRSYVYATLHNIPAKGLGIGGWDWRKELYDSFMNGDIKLAKYTEIHNYTEDWERDVACRVEKGLARYRVSEDGSCVDLELLGTKTEYDLSLVLRRYFRNENSRFVDDEIFVYLMDMLRNYKCVCVTNHEDFSLCENDMIDIVTGKGVQSYELS